MFNKHCLLCLRIYAWAWSHSPIDWSMKLSILWSLEILILYENVFPSEMEEKIDAIFRRQWKFSPQHDDVSNFDLFSNWHFKVWDNGKHIEHAQLCRVCWCVVIYFYWKFVIQPFHILPILCTEVLIRFVTNS